MRPWTLGVVAGLAAMIAAAAAPSARSAESAAWTSHDAAALREFLGGAEPQAWESTPELVILGKVMQFSGVDMARGATASAESLSPSETAQIEADLSRAMQELTAGRFESFSRVRVVALRAGETTPMFQRGGIVVGRFRGVHKRTGTLGYGGRTTRGRAITAGVVILDSEFDRDSSRRRVVRMHELGHALGYNHVESRPSLMNPRVGSGLTAFDRAAIEMVHDRRPMPSVMGGVAAR